MSATERLFHLALRDFHASAGAHFGVRDTWSLPMDYGDAAAEYDAIRARTATFDRSARSRFMVTGTDAGEVLSTAFAGHLEDLEEGRAMRTVVLDREGAIRDLVLVARTGGIAYLVSGEPGQRAETHARLVAAVGDGFDVRIDDRTETTCAVALAGPATQAIAAEHLSESFPARLQTLHCTTFEFHGFRALAIRTSDTGEDGIELTVAPAVALHLFETLRAAGVPLAGQSALDLARIEACIPAYRPDLEVGLSPGEADLHTLLNVPPGRRQRALVALVIEGATPPSTGAAVLAGEREVGTIRSTARGRALDASIALAVLDQEHALPGIELRVGESRASVSRKPLYRRRPSP